MQFYSVVCTTRKGGCKYLGCAKGWQLHMYLTTHHIGMHLIIGMHVTTHLIRIHLKMHHIGMHLIIGMHLTTHYTRILQRDVSIYI